MSGLYQDYPADLMEPLADTPKLQSEDVANAIMYMLSTPPGVQVITRKKLILQNNINVN